MALLGLAGRLAPLEHAGDHLGPVPSSDFDTRDARNSSAKVRVDPCELCAQPLVKAAQLRHSWQIDEPGTQEFNGVVPIGTPAAE
eukprot:8766669-Alexandrium_andersonii.AAC.1